MNRHSKKLSISAMVGAVALASVVIADVAPVVSATPAGNGANQNAMATQLAAANNSGAPAVQAQAVPVANVPQPTLSQPVVTSSLTTAQRLTRLENQMRNFTNMNLPQQISDMQTQLQQLSGQLQVQAHDLQLLNTQQRSFYQDVDSRIAELKNLVSNSSSDSSSSSSSTSTPSSNSTTSTSTTTTASAKTAAKPSITAEDNKAYSSAFALVSKKQFDQAVNAFQNYLSDYPNGRYVANAHYWLGEIYLQQGKIKQAKKAFMTVVKGYQTSNKVADSRLKLADIAIKQGHVGAAKSLLGKIQKDYPGTTAAQLAGLKLQTLNVNQ